MVDDPAQRGPSPFGKRASWLPPSWRVERLDTVDSTNRWVLERARSGAAEGLVAVADFQSAGRGRRGRTWIAPPGSSLLVSVLLTPPHPASELHVVASAAGLALRDAVARWGIPAGLKWPNDVVVHDRKLAGLLAESEASGGRQLVVVGIGCNLRAGDAWPPEIAATATACDRETDQPVERDQLLDALLDALSDRLGDLDAVAPAYRDALVTRGRRVRAETDRGTVEGVARDVDDRGRLIVETAGERRVLDVADVVHLR